MDQYWICGIVILAAFHGFLGTSALNCIQCKSGENCHLVHTQHRLSCPAESNICASLVEFDSSKGLSYSSNPTMKYTRTCAMMVDASNRTLTWPGGKKQCTYSEEAFTVKMYCYCNSDYCNSHTDFYLPDGRLIKTSDAASLNITDMNF